jgi:hypothetical protein
VAGVRLYLGTDPTLDLASSCDVPAVRCDAHELPAWLERANVDLIELIAPWRELTTERSRLLAEWAARDPGRGFGLRIARSDGSDLVRRRAAAEVNPHVDRVLGGCLTTAGPERVEALPGEAFSRRQADPRVRPCAVMITDHGAEHCIRLGDLWLCGDARAAPGPPAIGPEAVRSEIVFLNACSSLRLGDSVVPPAYSLAARLASQSSCVIGAFRNLRPVAGTEDIFTDSVMRNMRLGETVNRLNRHLMATQGGGPAYALLGSPCERPFVDGPAPRIAAAPPPSPSAKSGADTRSIFWWEQFSSLLERTGALSKEALEARRDHLVASTYARIADRVPASDRLDGDEIALLLAGAEQTGAILRSAILRDLGARVSSGRWLTSLISPFADRPSVRRGQCPRCGGTALEMNYYPFAQRAHRMRRRECDRCGTLEDGFGRAPRECLVKVTVAADRVEVHCPPLEDSAEGIVAIHRSPDLPHRPWAPGLDGPVRFERSDLALCGRTSVAMLAAGRDYFRASYATIFLEPPSGSRGDAVE